MAIRKRSMLAVALVAGFAFAIPACSSNDDGGGKTAESNTGSLGLNLVVGGLTLNSVTVTIENSTLLSAPIIRTVNVSSSQATVSAFVGGLPAGAGYTVRLAATATDGTTCGSDPVAFTVLANQTVNATVPVTCGTTTPSPSRGNVNINGTVTVAPQCAYLTNVVVAPLQVGVGETIDVSALASKSTGIGFTWSATNGTFGSTSAASTTYTCTVGGSQDITISLSSAAGCAPDVITAQVNCVGANPCGNGVVDSGEQCDPPAAGVCSNTCQLISSGTGGSGGATSGGATSGGATSGGATSGGATSGGASTGGTGTGGSGPNECTICQNGTCAGPVAARTNLCGPTGGATRALCDAYEACLASSNCANTATDEDGNPEPRFCYCGTVSNDACFAASATPTTPQGPCRDQFAALAGNAAGATPAPSLVGQLFFDISVPFGAEGQVLLCTQNNCEPNGYCAP